MEKYLKIGIFFTFRKKISVSEIKKCSKKFLNMPIRGEILKKFKNANTAKLYETNLNRYFCTDFIEIKVKKFLWKKKLGNCCKFRKFAKWPQTSLNLPIRWKIKKFKFAKFANFRNLQHSPKNYQMYQSLDKYEKNLRLTNFQILEIR